MRKKKCLGWIEQESPHSRLYDLSYFRLWCLSCLQSNDLEEASNTRLYNRSAQSPSASLTVFQSDTTRFFPLRSLWVLFYHQLILSVNSGSDLTDASESAIVLTLSSTSRNSWQLNLLSGSDVYVASTLLFGVFLGLQQPVVLNNTDQCNSLHQPDLLHGGEGKYISTLYFITIGIAF